MQESRPRPQVPSCMRMRAACSPILTPCANACSAYPWGRKDRSVRRSFIKDFPMTTALPTAPTPGAPMPGAPMPGAPISHVGALVARCCRMYAGHLAVTSASKYLSYAALEQRSNRLANALLAQGLHRGDRVGIYLPNCAEIVEIELACYKAGLVKAPFNARLSSREVIEIADNSDAALIVTTAEHA